MSSAPAVASDAEDAEEGAEAAATALEAVAGRLAFFTSDRGAGRRLWGRSSNGLDAVCTVEASEPCRATANRSSPAF